MAWHGVVWGWRAEAPPCSPTRGCALSKYCIWLSDLRYRGEGRAQHHGGHIPPPGNTPCAMCVFCRSMNRPCSSFAQRSLRQLVVLVGVWQLAPPRGLPHGHADSVHLTPRRLRHKCAPVRPHRDTHPHRHVLACVRRAEWGGEQLSKYQHRRARPPAHASMGTISWHRGEVVSCSPGACACSW